MFSLDEDNGGKGEGGTDGKRNKKKKEDKVPFTPEVSSLFAIFI